jgi:hypothetical protein
MRPVRTVCLDDEALLQVSSLPKPRQLRASSERPLIFTDERGTYSVEGIVQFIRANYTDHLLREVLLNLGSGVTSSGCSCIVSIVTAKHPPLGGKRCERAFAHYKEAMALPFAQIAFSEFTTLGYIQGWGFAESLCCDRLFPVLHDEVARRYRLSRGIVWAKKGRQM